MGCLGNTPCLYEKRLVYYFNYNFKKIFFILNNYIYFSAKKYCAMLNKENGVDILQKIAMDKSVDPEVCTLCYRILDLMNEFR